MEHPQENNLEGEESSQTIGDENQDSFLERSDNKSTLKNYRVLARIYRPQSFSDLLGQETMVQILTNAFTSGRLAHAYMLTGVRGIGKTTTARLLARALNYSSDDIDEPGTAYWSDDGSVNVDEDATNDLAQVSIKEYDNIAIDFINTSGAICFSSDGTWFQGNGGLLTGDVTHSVLYVCPLKNKVDRCIVNTEGIPNKQHEYIFEISWSRFCNVAMQKWNVKRGTWGLQ